MECRKQRERESAPAGEPTSTQPPRFQRATQATAAGFRFITVMINEVLLKAKRVVSKIEVPWREHGTSQAAYPT